MPYYFWGLVAGGCGGGMGRGHGVWRGAAGCRRLPVEGWPEEGWLPSHQIQIQTACRCYIGLGLGLGLFCVCVCKCFRARESRTTTTRYPPIITVDLTPTRPNRRSQTITRGHDNRFLRHDYHHDHRHRHRHRGFVFLSPNPQ